MTGWAERLGGHWWTIAPTARDWLPFRGRAGEQEVSIMLVDDRFGASNLSATFCDAPSARDVVVIVHGLGGNRRAGYVRRAARTLQRCGFATLAVDLRGADRRGGGFYHVAQVEDLRAVCRSPLLRRFENVFVLGFSMGGHLAVHFAARDDEARLRGVAGLCTPLDLQATQRHIDGPGQYVYRHYVLRGLKQIYAAVARRHRDVPSPDEAVQRCRTFREWDELTIAPRYGFETPEAFYEQQSAANVLGELRADTLLVLARNDPIVPPRLSLPHIAAAPVGRLRVRVLPRGGHLQFARGQSLGFDDVRPGGDVIEQLAEHWRGLAEGT